VKKRLQAKIMEQVMDALLRANADRGAGRR
jgi:hypothetical protein